MPVSWNLLDSAISLTDGMGFPARAQGRWAMDKGHDLLLSLSLAFSGTAELFGPLRIIGPQITKKVTGRQEMASTFPKGRR